MLSYHASYSRMQESSAECCVITQNWNWDTGVRATLTLYIPPIEWNCINDYMANDDYNDDYVIEPFSVLNFSRGFTHMAELISSFNCMYSLS